MITIIMLVHSICGQNPSLVNRDYVKLETYKQCERSVLNCVAEKGELGCAEERKVLVTERELIQIRGLSSVSY